MSGQASSGLWRTLRSDPAAVCFAVYFLLLHLPYLWPGFSQEQLNLYASKYFNLLLMPAVMLAIQHRLRDLVSPERGFWRLLIAAFGFWWIVSLVSFLLPWGQRPPEVALIIDGLYGLYYVGWFLAATLAPHRRLAYRPGRLLRMLRPLGALISAGTFLAYFIVVPSRLQTQSLASWVPSLYLYVAFDLILTLRFAYLARRARGRWRFIYATLGLVTLIMAALDMTEGLLYQEIFVWTSAYTNVLWNLPFIPLLLAARGRHHPFPASPQDDLEASPDDLSYPWRLSPLGFAVFMGPLVHLSLHELETLDATAKSAREAVTLFALVLLGLLALLENMLLQRQARDTFASRQELRRLRTEKAVAERADEGKSRFLAHVSHEIRTPMNGILGMADLLLKMELSADQQHRVGILKGSADGLLRILDDILEYSKAETSELPLSSSEMSIQRLLGQIVELFDSAAADKGLELSLEIESAIPSSLIGDASRLRQVVLNLVANALKFTPQGKIEIRAKLVAQTAESVEVFVEVRDTGIGIPVAVQPQLFQPFSQGASSTPRRFGGSGLGLAICRDLMDAMGGKIGFTSREGQGSEFWFELPLGVPPSDALQPSSAVPPRQDQEPARKSNAVLSGHRVLLVEDNPVNQLVTLHTLESLGVEVDVAGNGVRALEALEQQNYDLVLMDCQLPELDGYETTRRLRRSETQGLRVPVIAITAHAFEEDRQKCLDAGMDDFLAKPFGEQRLAAIVQRWLPLI